MKSVAEVYEVWCFLSLRKILIEALGFTEVESHKEKLTLNVFFELKLKDGLSGAGVFSFSRADDVKARLAHEPVFRKDGVAIHSYLATQKPDVLLEVTFPNDKKCIWLFDAKYRIKTKNDQYDNDDVDKLDFVPDDALNQMHRYRDALIHINDADGIKSKSRPVFGALYPDFFDQKKDSNPYNDLVFTARLDQNRQASYTQAFVEGRAKWYHIPTSVFNDKFGNHIAKEICYLAIAEPHEKMLEFSQIYRVISVKSVKRSEIDAEKSGIVESEVKHDIYWLFELGEPLTLNSKVTATNGSGFRAALKLTTLSSIHQTKTMSC